MIFAVISQIRIQLNLFRATCKRLRRLNFLWSWLKSKSQNKHIYICILLT